MGSKNFKTQATGAKLLPVVFEDQVLPGSFAHALVYLLDRIDLSAFEARYRNEDGGASAYHPRVVLKIVLLAYSRGVVHSRRIEALCRRDVQFMAASGDTRPQFSTIAHGRSGRLRPRFRPVMRGAGRQGANG